MRADWWLFPCWIGTVVAWQGSTRPRGVIASHRPPPNQRLLLLQTSVDAATTSLPTVLEDRVPSSPPALSQSLPRPSVPLLQLALAGSLTTFFADAVIHPIDCIKTLQQQQDQSGLAFIPAAWYLWNTGGLFQGLWTYASCDAVGGALKFAVWEAWKASSTLRSYDFIGAALAFVVASLAIGPGEFLKQQLQMAHYPSLGQAVAAVWAQDGLGGFFVGYDAIIMRDVPHTMLELCLYDIFKRLPHPSASNTSKEAPEAKATTTSSATSHATSTSEGDTVHPVLAAGGTGCVAGFLTTPMDTLKAQVMASDSGSLLDCLIDTVDGHGWTGLWAGALARVLWIGPFTMLYLPTYDFLHNLLRERHAHVSQLSEEP